MEDSTITQSTSAVAVSFAQMLMSVPEAIRKYLVSAGFGSASTAAYDAAKLDADERYVVAHTVYEVYFGDISLADFPDELWSRISWDDAQEERMRMLVLDLLGKVFLPSQAFVGDVAGLITELGGDVNAYPADQIELRVVSFVEGAKEIAAVVGEVDDDMRKRLRFIVESRLRDIRDDVETREMLVKAKKTGGMELSPVRAEEMVSLMGAKMRMTKYVEAKAEPVVTVDAGAAPLPSASATDIKKIYAGSDEEQEAIAKRVDRFLQVTENDEEKMREAYAQVLFPPDDRPTDPLYVVAGLLGMADGDRISDAVAADERFKAIVRDYLTNNGRDAEIAAFEADPTDAKYMNLFFQYVLRGIGEFDENDSARFALRLFNALKKQGFDRYEGLVAFDMTSGGFKWNVPLAT